MAQQINLDQYIHPAESLYAQALINGNFDIWQRAVTFTQNDDLYGPDRWNMLQEANSSWTFTRDTDVPTGVAKYSLKAANVTLNNQCAIVQIIENRDAVVFQNKIASLSFYAKTNSTEIANLRATVLAWTGTADTVTSDVISAWASDGTDPTFATNWTKEIAGSNKALTSSWQRFTIENISIDTAAITNLAVVIWVDDGTIAANDDFYVTGVQLNLGPKAQPLSPRRYTEELANCKRFYQRYVTPPMKGVGGSSGTPSVARLAMPLPVEMRAVPVATYGALPLFNGVEAKTIASVSTHYNTVNSIECDCAANTNWTNSYLTINAYQNGSAAVSIDAEL